MKTSTLESHFNQVADLKACNFIKKRLQHRQLCFPTNFSQIFIEHLFCRTCAIGCFQNWMQKSEQLLLLKDLFIDIDIDIIKCFQLARCATLPFETSSYPQIVHSCTSCSNLEMEPKYLTKSDTQLKPNTSRTKNYKRVL